VSPTIKDDPRLSPEQLTRVTDLVAANLERALRLSELAAAIQMSEYRFARAFQATTGDTVHKYIMKQRITRARELLAKDDLPLSAVAVTVGFSSQSHMTLAFQRNLSTTPGRYRSDLHDSQ